jgi:hypothetical protein
MGKQTNNTPGTAGITVTRKLGTTIAVITGGNGVDIIQRHDFVE